MNSNHKGKTESNNKKTGLDMHEKIATIRNVASLFRLVDADRAGVAQW